MAREATDVSLPTEQTVEKALLYLAESDEQYAQLYAAKDALKERIKIAKARAFLLSNESTAKAKEMAADCDPEVERYIDDWENTVAEYKLLESKRKRAEITIDVWRSVNASRRRT